mmetsp:Transcript_23706/g.68158  ORF Transcript_23706/g.68158 Transcript_23706/m.68158 type:complete len:227 (+) Transcript_23706:1326-2006(+)
MHHCLRPKSAMRRKLLAISCTAATRWRCFCKRTLKSARVGPTRAHMSSPMKTGKTSIGNILALKIGAPGFPDKIGATSWKRTHSKMRPSNWHTTKKFMYPPLMSISVSIVIESTKAPASTSVRAVSSKNKNAFIKPDANFMRVFPTTPQEKDMYRKVCITACGMNVMPVRMQSIVVWREGFRSSSGTSNTWSTMNMLITSWSNPKAFSSWPTNNNRTDPFATVGSS